MCYREWGRILWSQRTAVTRDGQAWAETAASSRLCTCAPCLPAGSVGLPLLLHLPVFLRLPDNLEVITINYMSCSTFYYKRGFVLDDLPNCRLM